MENEQKETERPFEPEVYGEPSPEDFIFTKKEIAQIEERTKQRQKSFRFIGIIVAVFVIIQGGYQLAALYSKDNRDLAKESAQFNEVEMIANYKEAVVTIQGQGSKGTGFSIDSDGYIMTNHHVVYRNEPLAVIFPDGTAYRGEIIDSNEEIDIALLKIDGKDLPVLPLRADSAKENEHIYVIGNPLSQTQIVNEGVVVSGDEQFHVMRISNPIFPGHSGSPVLSAEGEVVGVVYARTIPNRSDDERSYGLAVPIEKIYKQFPEITSLK